MAQYPRTSPMNKGHSTSDGFSLIEVLVTLVIVAIGLISIAQLQLRSLQYSHASLQRTMAVVQANDLVERMWTGYCDTSGVLGDSDGPGAIFEDWATFHLTMQEEQRTMPAWDATLDASNAPIYELNIFWDERNIGRTLAVDDPDAERFSFQYFFRLIAPDNPGLSC